ncbi:MAG TPA: ShlB/FhaC/HecB family hemolysin secretion/activation protein [Rhodanobacter sp.]|jgi:hemolysin activation/secretion protein|nr:ShlB/FhaC/HecB family hemolysin secretion/activation protein [Rhodanobacter sp.]
MAQPKARKYDMNIVKTKLAMAIGARLLPTSTRSCCSALMPVLALSYGLSLATPIHAQATSSGMSTSDQRIDHQQGDISALRCEVATLQKQLRDHGMTPAATSPSDLAGPCGAGAASTTSTPIGATPIAGTTSNSAAAQAATGTLSGTVASITLAARDITRPQSGQPAVDGNGRATSSCDTTSVAVNSVPALPALTDQSAADAYLVSLMRPGEVSAEPGVPTTDVDELKAKLHGFIGRPVDAALLKEITHAATTYVSAHTNNIVNVYVPPQPLRNGNLVVVLAAAKLGSIRTEGQKHISSHDLTCEIHMRQGDPVNVKTLTNDLTFLNNSPWRQVNSSFTPGAHPGDTDLILQTVDRYPLRVYGSWDNTGTELTGMDRFRVGANWGDAFGVIGSRLDYNFTWSDTFHKLQEHSLLYTMPVGQRDTLTFAGNYSASNIPVQDGYFNMHGKNIQASAQWTHLLGGPFPGGSQFTGGFEYKRIGDQLLFNGAVATNAAPRLYQFYAGLQIPWIDRLGSNTVNARFTSAPGFDNDTQFNAARPGAKSDYQRFDLTYDRYINLPYAFSLHGRFNGQWANSPLISSEQLQIAGAAAVRGYREDTLLADSGYTVNLELLTPAMPVLVGGLNGQLQGVLFYDFGQGFARGIPMQNLALDVTRKSFIIASTGFGLRFSINPYLSLKSEIGWSLRGPNVRPDYIIHNAIVIAY